METKFIEFTGSPKEFGFSTKEVFMSALSNYGFCHSKITKRDNKVNILACENKAKNSSKLKLAAELGIQVMDYGELAEAFDLEGDL